MPLNKFGRVDVRRCRICNQPLIATCDRTAEPELVKVMTGRVAEPFAYHFMYSTAEKQSDLCFRCTGCTYSRLL